MTYRFLLLFLGSYLLLFAQEKSDYKVLHHNAIVIDAHNDVVMRILRGEDISRHTGRGHSDLPRFVEGGIDVQVLAIWVPPRQTERSYFLQANERIDSIENFVRRNANRVSLARNAVEVESLVKNGRFVVLLGLEGGHPIENDLKKLEHFYNRGVRYLGLTWNTGTDWATSSQYETQQGKPTKRKKGLTPFGEKVVKRMNDIGMIIDLSHAGETTFWDVLKITRKPVIASHSSIWSLCRHNRNLKDDQLKAIARNGGVVFITFVSGFLDSMFTVKEKELRARNSKKIDSLKSVLGDNTLSESVTIVQLLKDEYHKIRPPLSTLIDHIDYAVKLIGADHVGLGSDFDGMEVGPLELDDVSHFPNITRELLKRGYSEKDIRKILGENFLRVLKEVEKK